MLVIPTPVPAMAMVDLAMLVLATLVLAMLAMLATLMLLSPLDPALDWTPSPRDLTL